MRTPDVGILRRLHAQLGKRWTALDLRGEEVAVSGKDASRIHLPPSGSSLMQRKSPRFATSCRELGLLPPLEVEPKRECGGW
jgi:hypothetical protein